MRTVWPWPQGDPRAPTAGGGGSGRCRTQNRGLFPEVSFVKKKKKMQNQKAGQKKYPNGKREVTQAFILSHPPPY